MGSSNASSNGLVVEGAYITGWAEANIESQEPGLIKQFSGWCDQRFSKASKITAEQISLAKIVWNARKTFAPLGASLTSDLLKLVRMQPDHPAFSGIKVVQWAENESDHAQKAFADALSRDKSLAGTEFYEGWGKSMAIDDWLIDFDVKKGKPKHTGYWKVVYIDDESDLTFVRKHSAVSIPVLGELKVAERDLPLLADALARSDVIERGVKGKIEHLTKLINSTKVSASRANDKIFPG
ncbi:hypothetical protein [Ochrobactrum sp. EDr1-4]|uniref:hypothetical protein n=1 Tax=Ochrobactrum sp. EDr1-4 TaxID=3368622 RepID=UPI003BA08F86